MEIIRHPNTMGQITVPKEYLDKLGLSRQDYFRIQLKDNAIVLTPMTVEPKFTEEELKKMQILFGDRENKGKVYPSSKQAFKVLSNRAKKR